MTEPPTNSKPGFGRRHDLIDRISDMAPDQRAAAVAASAAANKARAENLPVEVDWDAAIASLKAMLAELRDDE